MPINIDLTQEKISDVMKESVTGKIVEKVKDKVNKIMEKSKIVEDLQDFKEITWARVNKMLNNGKII